ncbi:MAG TPA: dynamin family protein [Candidatus Syntrophosphaera sp.]|nr:dynamin family protein [Candidatus Syntrophosphaera sp.]
MESRKSWLENQLLNQKTIDIVQRYLCKDTQRIWQAWHDQLGAEKFYLPVFGVQGSGKSTLLNAIFFDERVLPTDAQETTCVPAEIHYSPTLMGRAKVFFKNGSVTEIAANDRELAVYIDNVHNPGNEKGVSYIEVYSDDKTLENGLVVVDLPGYGSLTLENQQTTLDYLAKSSGVIYLIRSVPPLTRGEAYWLRITWPLLPQAIFCQSCWDTESNEEIEDARDHNTSVIRNEKKGIWGEHYEDPCLLCVNGEGALQAKFANNTTEYDQSGAKPLKVAIQKYSNNWRELTVTVLANQFRNDIESTLIEVGKRESLVSSSSEEIERAIEAEKKMFSEYKDRVTGKTDSALGLIDTFSRDVLTEINEMLRDSEMTFRNNMRTKLRAGIVDGERLNSAFQAESSDITEQLYYHVQDKLTALQGELRAELDGLVEWNSELGANDFEFVTPEKTKFENILPVIGNAVGGIGGAIGGGVAGAALGAKAGAALGVALGPAGMIVGTILGAAIGGLILGWLGRGGKKLVLDQRIAKVEPQVFSAISNAIESIREEINKFVTCFSDDTKKQISNWLQIQQDNYDSQMKYNLDTKLLSKDEKEKEIANLRSDKGILESIMKEMEAF